MEGIIMKRKVLSVLLCAGLTVSMLAGCGSGTSDTKSDEKKSESTGSGHPFYTGKQKLVDTSGRVDKFNKKYGIK